MLLRNFEFKVAWFIQLISFEESVCFCFKDWKYLVKDFTLQWMVTIDKMKTCIPTLGTRASKENIFWWGRVKENLYNLTGKLKIIFGGLWKKCHVLERLPPQITKFRHLTSYKCGLGNQHIDHGYIWRSWFLLLFF